MFWEILAIADSNILTLQAFTDLHLKPSPIHGSLKDIFTETFKELVKDVAAVTYAVGGIVSEKIKNTVIIMLYNEKQIYIWISIDLVMKIRRQKDSYALKTSWGAIFIKPKIGKIIFPGTLVA